MNSAAASGLSKIDSPRYPSSPPSRFSPSTYVVVQGGGGDKKEDDEDKKPKQSAAGKALAERMARQREEEERIRKLEVGCEYREVHVRVFVMVSSAPKSEDTVGRFFSAYTLGLPGVCRCRCASS